MNESERGLTKRLERAAATVSVDVDRMWDAVQGRMTGAEVTPSLPRRRRLTPYLAAASVATILVTASIVLADRAGTRSGPLGSTPSASAAPTASEPSRQPQSGPIGDWACRDKTIIEPGVNSMTHKPIRVILDPRRTPPEAVVYGVPRYRYTFTGSLGVLDYGDNSGRLISRTELAKTRAGWLVIKRFVCSGPAGQPSPDPLQLGAHTRAALPLDPGTAQLKTTPIIGTPLLIDDRMYYDPTGMLRHRTLYAFETKGGYQFASMPAYRTYSGSAWPEDAIGGADRVHPVGSDDTYIFADHDKLPLVLGYLTNDKTVSGLSIKSASTGTVGPGQHFAFPGGRTLYTVVSPTINDGDSLVVVHRTTGNDPPRRF
jgi:hypothetical protein